ncbi:MAG: ribosome-associated translation inhibitor RaiA [Rhodospirillaceae bacterium]|jgi:putative sigma-54 modulation protein|nr:ribosome-associated translation inhibitor RaiA [Rhodospirillaceae bacterium]MBT4220453.1 ribosome-associated translation inhibitor RaiA [Rhodospirillaceae bacterium]MBT4465008.1 ribosome-associated translation inhibitor RaiA [Rhodospirillaceae bacterium]MBT5014460.1 ribosome-associated translation inhibitor RaiA [Rhodospirillaceae bacterium]MBT5307960.1 ribosome-associated translation inhibitor RaiA [Rhodospirillaceae bacterium]
MTSSLRIVFHGMDHSDAVHDRIVSEIQKLEKFNARITSGRVTVEAPHHHKRKGSLYGIAIVLDLPGSELVVNSSRANNPDHKDIYIAIRDAFATLTRRVTELSDRQHAH